MSHYEEETRRKDLYMDKRLTRSDFVFILVFIFMLICAMGAFFYGVKLGTDRTENKYAAIMKQKAEQENGQTAYDQSYLVSFYHTVYLPFREFNLKWTADLDEVDGSSSADASSIMKELAKLADEKYDAILTQTMPDKSPLLKEGHQNYLKSLKLFSQAAKNFQSKANNTSPAVLLSEIDKNAYFTEAKNFALAAQKDYYEAIVKWQQATDKDMKGLDLMGNKQLSVNDWNRMSLNVKNLYIAGILADQKQFRSFTPQDVTLRVDELLKSGQAQKMNAASIPQVVDILAGTDAVRKGDFIRGKARLYADETLPQLPFFSKIN